MFDTARLKSDIFDFFTSLSITRDIVESSYASLVKINNYDYSIDKHLAVIRDEYDINVNSFEKEIADFKERSLREYVRPNVFELLEEIKVKNYRIILFSKGDYLFQDFKLSKSGLKEHFGEIVIVKPDENKEIVLRSIVLDETTYFINDNWHETERVMVKFPNLNYILFVRPDAQKFYNVDDVLIRKIFDFSELKELID